MNISYFYSGKKTTALCLFVALLSFPPTTTLFSGATAPGTQ